MTPLDHVGQPQQVEEDPPAGQAGGHTPLQEQFLGRLGQLVRQREEQRRTNPQDKDALRLLSRALYSTYMDCVSAGVGDQANAMMDNVKSGAH